MSGELDRFHRALEQFDAANAQDPDHELEDGVDFPGELLYARRMSRCLAQLAPEASEPLQLAARCQHIRRWEIPRSRYPMDRAGYHRWRSELAQFHAEIAGQVLREVGYDDQTIHRVQSLVRKEKLKAVPEAQLLEDVICLVFLEFYLAAFAREHEEQKVLHILRRTWRKMSAEGQAEALRLQLPDAVRGLVLKALDSTSSL